MSLGIPIVSSDLNGVFYDAGNKILGRVQDISDSTETADMMERLLTNKSFRDSTLKTGYEITQHTWRGLAKIIEKEYSKFDNSI
jgi:glycosyltransferase involved in cell wall biosynthesis